MRIAVVAAAVAILFQNACTSTTEPSGLVVTTDVSSPVFRPGSEITVRVTVANRGYRPIVIEGNPCPPAFSIATVGGDVVGPWQPDCDASSNPLVLMPREEVTFTRTWSGLGWLGGDSFLGRLLPPGKYVVTGAAGRWEDGLYAESRPILITLTP